MYMVNLFIKQNFFLHTLGGEGTASPHWMVSGSWIEYAKKHNAICFQLEHRFYGESHPTEDMSVKNLAYLTSTQALADLANFITEMNLAHNLTDAKWISFGGMVTSMKF